jgi:glycosyltransferase involved in cell wall biosynthesis/GT2 family glycosyltransferase
MGARTATVVVPTLDAKRVGSLLASLDGDHQTIVIDNGSDGGAVAAVCAEHGAEVVRFETNLGYSAAVNRGVERADGDAIVLVNDDCVCDPGFVERISAHLDAEAGIGMVAGVMRDWADEARIDTAGMELDRTLLVFDWLNGEPLSALERIDRDPIGPSAAAAAFDRVAFLEAGGFDERLFAYWEDVDLVLRLRREGHGCVLAPEAQGVHQHSATLRSGSSRKNYLMGYGRGYVLRKWGVLTPGRALPVALREAILCAGQLAIDRTASGISGRLRGYATARRTERYPSALLAREGTNRGLVSELGRRARRRRRLRTRSQPAERLRTLAVFHLADTSGPSRSLERELAWLASEGSLDVVLPADGSVEDALPDKATVLHRNYAALTTPARVRGGLVAQLRRLAAEVGEFRALIRERRPTMIVAVTSMLPAVSIAARLERIPVLVYCGELFDRGYGVGRVRALAGRELARLTGRLADGLIACSQIVARQFERLPPGTVEVVYPPHDERYGRGDGAGPRAEYRIAPNAPVLVSVGYLTEGRGQDVLIRAMPEILAEFPDARYLIVGDSFPRPQDLAYRQYLVGLIAQLKLQHAITLAGHLEDVEDVYAAADVIVNPARFNEPFGRVPFEAAIAGRPSVVTRVGAIPELLVDSESALIVEPDDPSELAAAVVRLLSDPELAETIVAGAREIIASRLTPEHSLAGFQRSVAWTLGRVIPPVS